MKTRVIKTEKCVYTYTCNNCGNRFSLKKPRQPSICYECDSFDSFVEDTQRIEDQVTEQFCPICNRYFVTSNYLNHTFQDPHTRWLANMVMHYRHEHTKSWDKMWSKNGSYYSKDFYYDSEENYQRIKSQFNERAKRQILRKCKEFMVSNGFSVEHVKALQNTEEKTIALYAKILMS